jgi:hypothetical protein
MANFYHITPPFFHHTPKYNKKEALCIQQRLPKEKEIPIATKIIGTEGLEPSLRTQAIALPTELRSKGEATSFRLLPGGV